MDLASLSNPLATIEQLSSSSSQLDGISPELERSVRFAGVQLTQAAGILLRLPQEIIAQAIVLLLRFYTGPEGGSFVVNSAKDISAASLYMTAKLSAFPQTPRNILNVYAYLISPISPLGLLLTIDRSKPDPEAYYLTEGAYLTARTTLLHDETLILRALAFYTKVITPHHLALTFLQTLGVIPPSPTTKSLVLAERTIANLNTALLSPQLLYLTHQPTSLAVAAIYLAAKDAGVKLPACEWWEVFDVDREELGFLILGLISCKGWVEEEKRKWAEAKCPLTAEEVARELTKEHERKADE